MRVKDPWGTMARVDRIEGDGVWLFYDGIDCPFWRSFDSLLAAQRGEFRSDLNEQYAKRVVGPNGFRVTLYFDP